jgi:hypothetical protein
VDSASLPSKSGVVGMADESTDDREPPLPPVVDRVLRASLALVCGYLTYLQTENLLVSLAIVPVSYFLFKLPWLWSEYR